MSNKARVVLLLIGGGVVLFIVVMSILGVGFARWMNCYSPFAPPQSKTSNLCR